MEEANSENRRPNAFASLRVNDLVQTVAFLEANEFKLSPATQAVLKLGFERLFQGEAAYIADDIDSFFARGESPYHQSGLPNAICELAPYCAKYDLRFSPEVFGRLPEWYAHIIKLSWSIYLPSLPAAWQIGVPLDENAIYHCLLEQLKDSSIEMLERSVEAAAWVLHAGLKVPESALKYSYLQVLEVGASVDCDCTDILFDHKIVCPREALESMLKGGGISGRTVVKIIKACPELGEELLVRAAQPDIFLLADVLEAGATISNLPDFEKMAIDLLTKECGLSG